MDDRWTGMDGEKKKTMIRAVVKFINYDFSSHDLLWEALQAPGSGVTVIGDRFLGTRGHQRLALVGNKALGLLIVENQDGRSYNSPGSIANAIDTLATNSNLGRVGKEKGIADYINQNPSSYGQVSNKTIATTTEAIIGAAYRDGGLPAAKIVMTSLGLD